MDKKKNAFTLIELLAIIVILAIIAVITVPIILNVIENSRKGAAGDSAYGFKDAIEKYYVSKLGENLQLNGLYSVREGYLDGNDFENTLIPTSGTIPTDGMLVYSNNRLIKGCLEINGYAISINDGKITKTEKGQCQYFKYTYWDIASTAVEETNTFDSSWIFYLQENLLTNVKEACGVFGDNKTVCIESGKWEGTVSEPASPVGGIYIDSKKNLIENYSSTSCSVMNDHMNCGNGNPHIDMYAAGVVVVGDTSHSCYINNNISGCS